MSMEGAPATSAPLEKKEKEAITLEQALEELKQLKASGIEDPEFTDDPRAKQFQEHLAGLEEHEKTLTGKEAEDYWFRRNILFVAAGYTDREHIDEAIEFLQEDLGNAEGVDPERVAKIEAMIEKVQKLLSPEQEKAVPTPEQIAELIRQPGRVPMEVHEMILAWKTARLTELGKSDRALIDVELEAARLYADNGHILDAIGSIVSVSDKKALKNVSPELKQELVDYKEELKRR